MSELKYDGAFPKGINVGAVVMLDGVKQITTEAYIGRNSVSAYFVTHPLDAFEAQIHKMVQEKGADDKAFDESPSAYGWFYSSEHKAYQTENCSHSGLSVPVDLELEELPENFVGLDKSWGSMRHLVKQGFKPGAVALSEYADGSFARPRYIERSQLVFYYGQLFIRHHEHSLEEGGTRRLIFNNSRPPVYAGSLVRAISRGHFCPQVA